MTSCVWFYPDTPVSFTNKTYSNDITEQLLKVALNTTTHNPYVICIVLLTKGK